ncbi:hypothetical protein H0W26_03885, partial [Candidatus Dependentiae bacterium]|nr:hypothetical protein [Candidatus Dependentiae bacterium]
MKQYSLSRVCLLLLSLFTVVAVQGSDLFSLGSFEKEKKRVYALGVHPQGENHPDSSVIPIYKYFLLNLSISNSPTRCILIAPKKSIQGIVTGNTRSSITTIGGLMMCDAASSDFQSGALEYRGWDYDHAVNLQLLEESVSFCMNPVVLKAASIECGFSETWMNALMKFLIAKDWHIDPFFKEKNCFRLLKKALIAHGQRITLYPSIKKYLTIMEAYDEKIKKLDDHPLISSLKEQWPAALERARCYIHAYTSEGSESKLIELVLNVIEKKQSYLAGLEEFQLIALAPLRLITKLEHNLLLVNALSECDKILFLTHLFDITRLGDSFREMGFEETIRGFLPKGEEMLRKVDTSFSECEISMYLSSIVQDTFTPQSRLEKAHSSCSYFDAESGKLVERSLKDRIKWSCHECHLSTETCNAFSVTDTKLHCSLTCLLTSLLKEKEEVAAITLSRLLNESSILSDSEKLIVKQFGALCYLRAALLMPSFGHEQGIVYQLSIGKIIKCLEGIVHCPDVNKPDTWEATLALCSAWNIDIGSLKTSLQVYAQLKKNYLQDLLKKRSKNLSYDTLSQPSETTFSENKFFAVNQQSAFTKLKTAFDFLPSTDNTSLLFIYRELVNR